MNHTQSIPSALILSVGCDPSLLSTRSLLLQSAGYAVESASSVEDAIRRFRQGDFDLVILCHSLPEKERQRLIVLIRDYGSTIPLLLIAAASAGDVETSSSSESAPAMVLSRVHEVLQQYRPA